jgi:hypothetical protein
MSTNTEDAGAKYFRLVIEAERREGQIWLGDDAGHLVQKAVGVLDTQLLPGSYVVEFTLGGPTYPVTLLSGLRLSEQEIRSGPSCPRPKVRFTDG